MRRAVNLAFVALVGVVGCHKQPAAVVGALTASPAVRALGVDSYVLDSNGAELYKEGARVGRLSITAVSSDERLITVNLDDGRDYDAQVQGRDENGFNVGLTDEVPVQAFQVDPALAPLFTSYDMTFPLAKHIENQGTQPSNFDLCAVPWPGNNCREYSCVVTNNTWSGIQRLSSDGASCPTGKKIMPGTSSESCPPGTTGNTGCYCGVESFTGTTHAACAPLTSGSCYSQGKCDDFTRVRTCADPGATCSSSSNGVTGCTTQLPNSGTCSQADTVYAINYTKAGTGSGTVTSNDGVLSCGATCSANERAGNVVVLTATPSGYDTFAGWTGACTGTGTCTLTMDAAKNVTATFTACARQTGGGCGADDGCGGCQFGSCGRGYTCDTSACGCINI